MSRFSSLSMSTPSTTLYRGCVTGRLSRAGVLAKGLSPMVSMPCGSDTSMRLGQNEKAAPPNSLRDSGKVTGRRDVVLNRMVAEGYLKGSDVDRRRREALFVALITPSVKQLTQELAAD